MGSFQIQWLTKRFGSIPKFWSTVPLDDLFEERRETSSDTTKYPLHSLIIGLGIVPKTDRYNRAFLLRDEEGNQYKLVYPGDFVFNPMNLRFGAIAYSRCESVVAVSAYYNVLKPRKSKFDTQYLYELLVSYPMVDLYDLVAIGSLIEKRRVHWSEFRKLVVPLPPLDEQKAIGAVIRNGDKAIALTEQLIAAKQQRKKALMQQLLTGRVRFPEFEGKEWREVRLGDLGETYSGLAGKSKDDFGQGKPYIPYLNIYNNWAIDPEQMDYVSIEDGERQNRVKYGDIFFSTSSETPQEVGMSSVLLNHLEEAYLNSFCYGFRLKDFANLLPEYAVYLLRGEDFRHAMHYLAQGATRYNLTKRYLLEASLRLPPLAEQRKIAKVLSACDREIDLLTQKLDALQRQKKGLMQQLLTGRTRVKV